MTSAEAEAEQQAQFQPGGGGHVMRALFDANDDITINGSPFVGDGPTRPPVFSFGALLNDKTAGRGGARDHKREENCDITWVVCFPDGASPGAAPALHGIMHVLDKRVEAGAELVLNYGGQAYHKRVRDMEKCSQAHLTAEAARAQAAGGGGGGAAQPSASAAMPVPETARAAASGRPQRAAAALALQRMHQSAALRGCSSEAFVMQHTTAAPAAATAGGSGAGGARGARLSPPPSPAPADSVTPSGGRGARSSDAGHGMVGMAEGAAHAAADVDMGGADDDDNDDDGEDAGVTFDALHGGAGAGDAGPSWLAPEASHGVMAAAAAAAAADADGDGGLRLGPARDPKAAPTAGALVQPEAPPGFAAVAARMAAAKARVAELHAADAAASRARDAAAAADATLERELAAAERAAAEAARAAAETRAAKAASASALSAAAAAAARAAAALRDGDAALAAAAAVKDACVHDAKRRRDELRRRSAEEEALRAKRIRQLQADAASADAHVAALEAL
jgi:hypothetical protein